ncbi:peptidoglycan DD-metalloendopeptidase family protein [Bacillus sp. JJ1764]|uniref:peptidoglycan DD-metalloendopeptidase family protein n=1 Tax=Bacillus sp. JJ1764 TaxID=3122964 RepID=UPI003F68B316
MALCVSLLFLGGRHTDAAGPSEISGNDQWIWPSDGVISDTFGTRHGKHKGIDIAGKINTPVLAVDRGQVVKSYFSNTYGNVVFIKHPSNLVTVYAHLNRRDVFEGQTVNQGEMIGSMGRTGQATGTHLHFESHQLEWSYDKRNAIDPERILGKADVGDLVKGGIASAQGAIVEVSSQKVQQTSPSITNHIATKYTVKQGDTLSSIAQKNNVTVTRIKEINRLTTDLIQPNQILTIR